MAYCFDTSAFLECWTRYYPPDIFPGLWDKLSDLAAYKQIVAPEEVRRELEKQEDDLTLWVQQRPHIFVPLDGAVQTAVRKCSRGIPSSSKPRRTGTRPIHS